MSRPRQLPKLLRVLPRPRKRKKTGEKILNNSKDGYMDTAYLILDAIAESSDAFAPLKSAASLVRFIVDTSQKMKDNRDEADELAQRALLMLFVLHESSASGSNHGPDGQNSKLGLVNSFIELLDDISKAMEGILHASFFQRVRNSKQHADLLREFKERVHTFQTDFLVISSEMQCSRIGSIQENLKDTQSQLQELSLLRGEFSAHAKAQERNWVLLSVGLF